MGIVRVGMWACCGVQLNPNSSRSCAPHSQLQNECADNTLHYVDL